MKLMGWVGITTLMISVAARADELSRADRLKLRFGSESEVRTALNPQQLRDDDELHKIINEEMQALRRSTGLASTKIELTDEPDATASYPSTGLIFSRTQLEKIKEEANVTREREIIRLILAHEMAHQIQFKKYGANTIKNASMEELRKYECQADLLAAKYLIESFTPGPDGTDVIMEALEVMFGIGEPNALGDHPTHEARRAATRRGMSAGMYSHFQNLPGPLTPQTLRWIAKKIDLRAGDDILPWSLRQASRIVHTDEAAFKDLEISSPTAHRGGNGYATVSVTITNNGDRAVEGDFEIRCDLVDRNAEDEAKSRLLWDAQNFTTRLGVGESKRFTANLLFTIQPGMLPMEEDPKKYRAVFVGPDNEDFGLGTFRRR